MTDSPTTQHPARRMRELLQRPGLIRSMGAHDVFTALLIQEAGFETVFLGGFGATASLLGLPDLGFMGAAEMADAIRRTTSRLSIPVIADGDTGYGDLHQVQHTVEMFEQAGASGIILEDQVAPKRCGHFGRKAVISAGEMVLKIRAAVAARRNPDFLIFVRTDALEPHGFEEAVERVNRCAAAGADVAFIEAPQTLEQLQEIPRRVRLPAFVNMLSGGVTPILPADELERLGYKVVVCPVETLMVCAKAVRELCRAWQTEGRVDGLARAAMTFGELKQFLGVERYLSLRADLKGESDPAASE